jgi:hypothetical protein
MSSTDLVRSSRDGDQFHYYWAARQCLKMLLPGSGLAAVSIEGSSPEDPMAADGQRPGDDPTGEYVVDIAEYYGDAAPDRASKIVYRQLKHSTEHPDQPWTVWPQEHPGRLRAQVLDAHRRESRSQGAGLVRVRLQPARG